MFILILFAFVLVWLVAFFGKRPTVEQQRGINMCSAVFLN